ncbi:helix-turn-helix transcriptional regulator [Streptomyces sp. ICBB 8177]|uniref:helix-turn-helix domain-containing protein n=1 Tax=Streptomyces sp. ICBB 8177 TaxID=563922 RepID=UPI000D6783CA|nr:helix-turn-helix transcriptional regulator [Streptomyces sp. ICBB 8177]PWI45146.1 hypothetical protein CK485_07905 [Streptomyces sp. ICBB 8177]
MDESAAPQVGAGIRRRRRVLDLTLAEVASRTAPSVPFLSQVENDRARSSMRSLQSIVDALGTTAVQLLSAADGPRRVDVVRAEGDPGLASAREGGARSLVRGQHQLHALEFVGAHDADREFEHRNDELMSVADGAAEVVAEGATRHLRRGDTLHLTGRVRHRWRAVEPGTRVVLVAVADHVDVTAGPPR